MPPQPHGSPGTGCSGLVAARVAHPRRPGVVINYAQGSVSSSVSWSPYLRAAWAVGPRDASAVTRPQKGPLRLTQSPCFVPIASHVWGFVLLVTFVARRLCGRGAGISGHGIGYCLVLGEPLARCRHLKPDVARGGRNGRVHPEREGAEVGSRLGGGPAG